jgi:hypothetical protein
MCCVRGSFFAVVGDLIYRHISTYAIGRIQPIAHSFSHGLQGLYGGWKSQNYSIKTDDE